MKHNYTAYRFLDDAATATKGGDTDLVLKAIEKLGEKQKAEFDASLKKSIDELQVDISAAKVTSQKAADDVKEIKAKQATSGMGSGVQFKNFHTELGDKLTERKEDLANYRSAKRGFKDIEMETKVVGNLASATSLTGSYFVPPQVVPGIQLKPYEQIHLRDILPVGQTTSNLIRYIRDTGGQGGPAMVAEGGTKPQIDRSLQIFDANVRKMATYFRVPEEMIDDIPYLQSFLSQIGVQEVMVVEDAQILYGDGTGQNLSGLMTNATAFAAGTSIIGASANQFDVIQAARKQGRVAKFYPSIALVNPVDYYDMISKKDTTNNYLFLGGGNGIDPQTTMAGGMLTTQGVRIIEHTAITIGDFLVFDPSKAAIFDRMGTVVKFYDQDQDNAIKNLITIVIEKRLALPIYQPLAFIKGTFSTAITDLTS